MYSDGQLIRIRTWGSAGRHRKLGVTIGCVDARGYLVVWIRGRIHKIHRLVWLYFNETVPGLIDHIDRNPLNNRIENLRASDKRQNYWNSDAAERRSR